MQNRSSLIRIATGVLPLLWCQCLISTNSLNHGKILKPGEGMISAAGGWKRADIRSYRTEAEIVDANYPEGYRYETRYDTITQGWLTICFDYRLGLLSKYPFGKGAEIGFHVEQSLGREFDTTVFYRGKWNSDLDTIIERRLIAQGPPQVEFSGRFGLPGAVLSTSILHHNIEIGWIVGGWTDNGWFLGYAAGAEFRRFMPYAGLRATLNPTNVIDRDISISDSTFFTNHNRTWHLRLTAGTSLILPALPALPDFITPEISFYAPHYRLKRQAGITLGLGLRWMNGI